MPKAVPIFGPRTNGKYLGTSGTECKGCSSSPTGFSVRTSSTADALTQNAIAFGASNQRAHCFTGEELRDFVFL